MKIFPAVFNQILLPGFLLDEDFKVLFHFLFSLRTNYLNLALRKENMSFPNEKKIFLLKQDKSKKGTIDPKIIAILNTINSHPYYYTTSSCSGRVCLWCGGGKKNESEQLKVSHEAIEGDFLSIPPQKGVVWLRVEPLIVHLACKDLKSAVQILKKVRPIYKKSCFLSLSNKIIIEIRGSEFLEMPLYNQGNLLFQGDLHFLQELINEKMMKIDAGREKLETVLAHL